MKNRLSREQINDQFIGYGGIPTSVMECLLLFCRKGASRSIRKELFMRRATDEQTIPCMQKIVRATRKRAEVNGNMGKEQTHDTHLVN